MTTLSQTIPLGQLSHSAANTRKTKASPGELAELVASIKAHGLLENLVVSPSGEDNFEVVAGGRRFDALQALVEAGDVPADFGVPCTVLQNGVDVSEVSLAENMVRVAMHPADQVEAFCRLHGQGSTVEQIATRFGVTETVVNKRIRLGGVAPKLLKEYRAGNIDLSTVMAFTITNDHKRQLKVFKELSESQERRLSAWAVKRVLTDAKLSADSDIARYVGIAAYEKAGGTVTKDLFADEREDGVYLDNPTLVQKLATEKLEKTAVKLRKQWKWADVVLKDVWSVRQDYDRIFPEPGQPTDEEAKEIERINAEKKADGADIKALNAELSKISDAIHRREVWSDEQLQVAGCIVSIGHNGKGEVTKGLVKPEDKAKARKAGGRGSAGSSRTTNAAADARKDAGISSALADDLATIRTALVKVELLNRPEVAQDLLTFQMVRSILFDDRYLGDDALDVQASATHLRPAPRMNDDAFVKSSPGEPVLRDEGARLRKKYGWIEVSKDAEVAAAFKRFRKQKPEAKASLLAYCVACTVKNQLAQAVQPHGAPALEAAIAEIKPGFILARPAKEVLWNRVSKPTMIGILTETVGEEHAKAQASKKKGEIADYMERLFANPSADEFELTKEEQERVRSWTPIGFRPTEA